MLQFCIQPPLQSPPKVRSSTLVKFHLPISPLLVHKIILTIPTNTPILHLFTFAYNHPNSLYQKYFPYYSHLANSDGAQ